MQAEGTKNLVVMRKGHLFSFDVIDEQGMASIIIKANGKTNYGLLV